MVIYSNFYTYQALRLERKRPLSDKMINTINKERGDTLN